MKCTTFFILAISLLSLVDGCSCKKSVAEPQLPPITQTGANTFGCKVNGKVWVPYWPCDHTSLGSTELRYWVMPVNTNSALPVQFALQAGEYFNPGSSIFNIAFRQSGIYIWHWQYC
ncbi:MAG: hypothetical protein JST47_09105 [Bacteroidetes bacterium]|nr:hypothetical protein [Bacteroidota bacterium]